MGRILSLIFPDRCPYCREVLKYRQTVCEKCRKTFPSDAAVRTLFSDVCCIAPFFYEGTMRRAILDYKFKGARSNAENFSEEIALIVKNAGFSLDVVTYVPASFSSRWRRGFDQSDLVARKTAGKLGVPFLPLLKKTGKNKVQHELDHIERRNNVIGVYTDVMPEETKGRNILLIDDICTTGSTLSECSRMLISAGAKKIYCASIAIVREQ